ncbi:MAG TPA: energy transducer TonB [Cellvibrionaceae bacterium]
MKLTRLAIAVVLAVVTTFGLLFLMHSLINSDLEANEDEVQVRVADIRMPKTDIDTRYDTEKPDRPEDPEQPPPDIPEPDFEMAQINPDGLNMAPPSLDGNINIGFSGLGGDGEFLPIVRAQPVYPRRAAQRGLEGAVTLEFTVTTSGTTRDVVVIEGVTSDGEPTTMFNSAAIRAVERYKYRPRVVDGTPVEVPGVQIRLIFEMGQ